MRSARTAAPALSVVIPSFNEVGSIVRTVARCFDFAAAPDEIEIVVADGGSTDGTADAVRAAYHPESNVRVVASHGFGRGAALDAGTAASASERLMFLHADAAPPPRFDRLAIDAIDDASLLLGAFSFGVDRTTLSTPHPRGLVLMEAGANARSRLLSLPYGDQALFASRAAIEELGGWCVGGEEMPMMEDIALVRRASALARCTGRELRVLDEAVLCDGRRWARLGVLRTMLTNQMLVLLYDLGVAPATIFKWYYGVAPPPRRGAAGAEAEAGAGTLFLVAKWPMAGTSKTRLAGAVGNERAVALAKAMLADLLHRLGGRDAAEGGDALRRVLYYAPRESRPDVVSFMFAQCGAVAQRWELLPMPSPAAARGESGEEGRAAALRSPSLSALLRHALAWAREDAQRANMPAIFIGSDCPDVPRAAIDDALAECADATPGVGGAPNGNRSRNGNRRAFLCPSSDGGYTLLGVGAGAPLTIFDEVKWSSVETSATQLAALSRNGVETRVWGDATRDIDEMADARALLESAPEEAPRTLRVLRAWRRDGVI